MSSWLDMLPSNERAKIRARLRSPQEYQRLREKVKGPEELEREMEHNEGMAELKFAMETEPIVREALAKQVQEDLQGQGLDTVLDAPVSPDQEALISKGNFTVSIEAADDSANDQLVVHPEGNIAEKIPVKPSFTEQYVSQFQSNV